MKEYDLIVIGAGPGGYETAAHAAAKGLRTAIVEKSHLGGTCLNLGCIPTKALCHSAEELLASDTDAAEKRASFAKAAERKDEIVTTLRSAVADVLANVDIFEAEATFTGPHTIKAGDENLTAPKIIVATGSKPAALPIEGAEYAVSSDALLTSQTLPESIIIIGGGVIGMEFASVLNAFGVDVTVLEYCKEIIPTLDAEIAKRLRMELRKRGIKVVTSAQVTQISADHEVTYLAKGKPQTVKADSVLMAVGRRPIIPAGLQELGVELNRGAIAVDDNMQTSIEGVYAVGDVNGRLMLAHAASAQGLVALGEEVNLSVVPSAIFTHPECASVGLTEQQCANNELNVKIGKATFRTNGKALAEGQPEGMVKVITDADSGKILGCHICGAHAADLIIEPTLAISAGLTAHHIATTIHAHPTLGEVLARAVTASM